MRIILIESEDYKELESALWAMINITSTSIKAIHLKVIYESNVMDGLSRFLNLDNYTSPLPFNNDDENSTLMESALWAINHLIEEN
jgi:hypothetical protein